MSCVYPRLIGCYFLCPRYIVTTKTHILKVPNTMPRFRSYTVLLANFIRNQFVIEQSFSTACPRMCIQNHVLCKNKIDTCNCLQMKLLGAHKHDRGPNNIFRNSSSENETEKLHKQFNEFLKSKPTAVHDECEYHFFIFSKIYFLAKPIHLTDTTIELQDRVPDSTGDCVKNQTVDPKYWKDLYNELCEKCGCVSGYFKAITLSHIAFQGRPDLAISFLKYMLKYSRPRPIDVAKVISICVKEYPEFACDVYDKYIADKQFDDFLVKVLIQGFAESTKWRMCFDLLDKLDRDSDGYYVRTIQPLLKRLLQENDIDTFYTYYGRTNYEYPMRSKILEMQIHIYQWWWYGEITTESMLDAACKCNVIFDHDRAVDIVSYIKGDVERSKPKENLTISVANVHNQLCTSCSRFVPQDCFTPEQFVQLKRAFTSTFLMKEQVFRHTSPDEIQRYIDTLKKLPKIDVVFDEPNISSPDCSRTRVLSILQQLRRNNKTVLIMRTVDVISQKNYPEGVCMYKVPYGSPDDLFLLMAAMHFGFDTLVFTNDKFRDYRKRLSKDIQEIFILWQKCRQITHMPVTDLFKYPYNTVADKHEHGWHVPYFYDSVPMDAIKTSFHTTKSVLCITKRK